MQQARKNERKNRLQERNMKVRTLLNELVKKYPQWRLNAVIEEVSERVFLSPRTIEAILSNEGIYKD